MRWLLARPTLAAALIYGGLSLLMFAPGLMPGRVLSSSDNAWVSAPWNTSKPPGVPGLGSNPQLGDLDRQFQPFMQHTRRSLPDVPLWDPYIMAGRPFLANAQSAVFSPFSLPAYVLPFWRSFALIAAFKLFVAAFGTFLAGRALGMSFAGGLLAGVAFGLSLWLVSWQGWPLASAWVFLPWLWLLADRIARAPSLLVVSAMALGVGLTLLAGHPQSSFHALASGGLFFVIRLIQLRPREGRSRYVAHRAAAFAGAAALGAGLAALTLVPFVELLSHSADISNRKEFADLHTEPRYLLGVFLHGYWGRPTETLVNAGIVYERAFYAGAIVLMLAGLAVIVRPSAERVTVALIGAFSLCVAVGAEPFTSMIRAVPGFSVSQNARLGVVFVFCMALLAGWGASDLAGAPERLKRKGLALALAAVVLVAPLIWVIAAGERPPVGFLGEGLRIAWGFASPPSVALTAIPAELEQIAHQIHFAALLEWAVLGGLAFALIAVRTGGWMGTRAFAVLAVLLCVGGQFKAGMGFNPAIESDTAVQPLTPALRYLEDRRPNRFVGMSSPQPFIAAEPLQTNLALRYRLFDARGYDFPIEERFYRFWRREIGVPGCAFHFCATEARASPRGLRALGLLGVTDLLQDPIDPVVRMPGLRLRYAAGDGRVYSNARAVPRASIVDSQRVVGDGDEALRAVASPAFQARDAVVTERRLAGVSTRQGQVAPGPAGRANIEDYRAERVTVRAIAPRTSVLVLSDLFFPGWKATVDGRQVPIHRVDYLLRGVVVMPGRHTVDFRYEPATWRAGLAISAVSLLVLVGLAAAGWRRQRPATRAASPA